MIRLDLPREPHWLDLPHGVRLLVRPLDTATDAAARATAVTDLRERAQTAPPAAAKESWRAGQTKDALARALGQLTILDWLGVLLADGSLAPVTAESVVLLMAIPKIATAFLRQIYAPLDRLAAEGEGCGAALHGTGRAAPGIVAGAGATGETAADSAHM
ncbi:MAG: hypothetical protein WCJ64_12870 [Rhodospirillaceae bacterium]